MDGRSLWFLAYISVLSIRLHPRNDESVERACVLARVAADKAYDDFVAKVKEVEDASRNSGDR